MEEQRIQLRDWKLTMELALGGGVVLTLILLLTQSSFGTSVFFGCISAIACGWCGPEMLAPVLEALPRRSERQPRKKVAVSPVEVHSQEKQTQQSPSFSGNLLDLAEDVQVEKSDLAGKAIFVCGIRRHGKTTLGARLAEQLGKHYIPLFIPCLEGDYLSLADKLPRAIVASHSSMDSHYSAYDFVPLDTAEAAYKLGYDILDQGYQVIFDMSPYSSIDQATALEINVIRGMFHWANTHPHDRVPAHVFKDEAQRYLPQNLSDSVITDQTVLRELLRVYMDIIAIGGKRGIAPVVLTQRFAQVNNKIMAQSEVFFLLRQTNDNDLDRCMRYVDGDVTTREDIKKFQPGEGVYIAYDGSQLVTHFKQRESSGKRSSTPQADAALRYKTMPLHHSLMMPRGNRTAILPEMEEIRVNPAVKEEVAAPPTSQLSQHALPAYLQETLDILTQENIPLSDLAKRLQVSKTTAHRYVEELKARRKLGSMERSTER